MERRRKRRFAAFAMLAVAAVAFVWAMAALCMRFVAESRRMAAVEGRAELAHYVAQPLSGRLGEAKREAESLLAQLPGEPSAEEMAALERSGALVRNAFLWRSGEGVTFPTARGATEEERRFLARYVTLFEEGFGLPAAEGSDDAARKAAPRRRRGAVRAAVPEFTWRSWFEGDRLSFIGWRRLAGGDVAGIELETVSLMADFARIVRDCTPADFVVDLRDGAGRVLSRSASHGSEELGMPHFTLSLDPDLPRWELAVWRTRPVPGLAARAAFAGAAAVALCVFLFAGIWTLAREARRDRLDSMRKTSFVANVSHELKTPLTAIRLAAEMLQEGRVADDAARRKYLAVISGECRRLTRLVGNILDFGRLEQGRMRLSPERLDLAAAVADAAETQRGRAEGAGMVLSITLPDGPVWRTLDRDALSQIVVNLVDNAVKYAAEGKAVDVSVSARGEATVADRGPGIAPRHRGRVFERFYRCDESNAAPAAGSGLGLNIARRLAEAMGGTLDFAPRAGGGASFTLAFPPDASGGPGAANDKGKGQYP